MIVVVGARPNFMKMAPLYQDFSQSEVQENKVIEESILTLLRLFSIELEK